MNTDKERELFEASNLTGRTYRSHEPGRVDEYEDPFTQFAWKAWQARAALDEQKAGPSDEIDIEDVRQYLDSWGCLAHPGVRALLSKYAAPAPKGEPVALVDRACIGQIKWTAMGALRAPSMPDGTELYTAPVNEQDAKDAQPSDEDLALILLDTLFSAWEDGTPCYERPDLEAGFLGNAFRLDDHTIKACVALLERRRPRCDAIAQQGKGE